MQVIENDVMVEERVFNFNGPDDDSDDFDGDEDGFELDDIDAIGGGYDDFDDDEDDDF
ncbi:MAG: hypothetical protein ACI35Z_04415 [Sphingobacterium hotanense]